MYVFRNSQPSFDLEVKDDLGTRRKFLFSSVGRVAKGPLHVRLPSGVINQMIWNNVCLDIHALMDAFFPERRVKSIDKVTLRGPLKLRRIYTMK